MTRSLTARCAALGLLVSALVAGGWGSSGAPAVALPPDAPAISALGGDGLWTPSSAPLTPQRGGRERSVEPRTSRAYRLDGAGLAQALASAPLEGTTAAGRQAVRVTVPAPTGELVTFSVVESPVLEAGIQRRHPEIRTYAGTAVGFADSIRLDVTPAGFHAAVRGTGHPSWYVDPAYQGDTGLYVTYFGNALPPAQQTLVEPELLELDPRGPVDARPVRRAVEGPGQAVVQRVYRLALLNDTTYAEAVAPGLNDGTRDAASNAAVLAAKVTLLNRVNEIFSDDLSVKMVLVDGSDDLNLNTAAKISRANGACGAVACFAAADIAQGGTGCTGELVNREREVIGLLAGADNFDIGHFALGIDAGGIAGLDGVGTTRKAHGCTGISSPFGDRYAVDFIAHEVGHQFGAEHTFASPVLCDNRVPETSVEPGSGTSVMAYADLCGSDNLQPRSDAYFAARSTHQVRTFIGSPEEEVTEVQAVALSGFDGAESFTLGFGGATTTPITNGTSYTRAGIQAAVEAATGASVTVTGLFGSTFSTSGFEITYDGVANEPAPTLNAGAGHTGIANTLDEGGPTQKGGSVQLTTTNHHPVVSAAPDRTIPIRTPFALTGSATDADGDPLSYLWEQNDRGGATGTALVDNDKTDGPLFRMFGGYVDVSSDEEDHMYHPAGKNRAGTSPTRVFPDLAQVLAGATNAATGSCPATRGSDALPPGATLDCYSEFLPTSAYVGAPVAGNATPPRLNFRLTARDMRAVGGGTAFDDTTLTLSSAGPFALTSQRLPVSFVAGAEQSVTWAVNGTDAPSLAPRVRISFSTDGGSTFPIVLADEVPNDGATTVTVPDVSTTEGRLKVEAVGNYFFDVNDAPITVGDGGTDTSAPDTFVVSGPRDGAVLRTDTATFRAGASEAGASFACRLDGAARPCPGGSLRLTRLTQTTHTVAITATDAAGNRDPSATTSTFTVPVDSTVLKPGTRGFERATSPRAYLGTYSEARRRSASLVTRVSGARSLALVVGRLRNGGSVTVYLGARRLRTLSLRGSGQRVLTFATFPRPTSGRLRIVSTSNRPVRIEGLAVLTK